MTKDQMQAELGQLRAENAALRDLLAAVQETAVAGSTTHGQGGQLWYPAHQAAQRTEIWLEHAAGKDAEWLTLTAGLFREHVGDIKALGEPVTAA